MKFKVGDRVKTKGGKLGTIKSYLPHDADADYKVLLDGDLLHSYYFSIYLELIQPEVKEPIPGKYYRTGKGEKVFYIGKNQYGYYVYQDTDDTLNDYPFPLDVVGEWAEAITLPSLEIKRWAVVSKVRAAFQRGYVVHTLSTSTEAEEYRQKYYGEDFEIVELTGTLPKRKV